MNKLAEELRFFRSHPRPMKVLLATNFIYSLVVPVIELFIGAYIIRNSADFSLVMVFQLAQGTGIPITFYLNGILLRRFSISRMYAAGMLLSSISMGVMMLLKDPDTIGVMIAGLIMGFSYGFFWANRNFLALTTTRNENRNYYYGLETFFSTLAVIIVPFAAGAFISGAQKMKWFSDINTAYHILTGVVFILTLIASVLAHQGKFQNPKKARLLFFNFHRLWQKMLGMAALKGLAQGYIITAPVMLIMKQVGSEGSLGLIQSGGAFLSAILLYILGRKSHPEHRLKIFTLGLFLFLLGSLINAILYSAAGVIFFVACLVFSRPLLDMAYFPIQLGVTEFVAHKEKRNQFAYIFSHELGLYVGRLFGCTMFILLSRYVSEDWALRYALLIIAAVYFISVAVAGSIVHDRVWHEPTKDDQQTLEELKQPIAL
jgi:MFS transporter, YQGE family, putative transporter